ncbi:MAG TPA: PEGA domain-containing protein [Candidatus Polarisedimenticolia bacterium]|nr:PEGA domain-containing protein [Candidatus Polarisedimenticolia bacterium]
MKTNRIVAAVLAAFALSLFAPHAEAAADRKIRGHSPSGHGGRGRVVVRHGPIGYYYYQYAPYYYGPYVWGHPAPWYYDGGPRYIREIAYLDTDIAPEEAEVYLDGEYVGIADDFDGFPAYLTLEPGAHTIHFKAEGRRTVKRSIKVPRGAVLGLEFTLPEGVDDAEESAEIVVPPADPDSPEEYAEEPAGEEPGFIRLKILPDDASVYIDGELSGSAAQMTRLHGELRLSSGRHRIDVVRPGYRPVKREIELGSGDRVTVEITLVAD